MLVDLDIKISNICLPIMLGASLFFLGEKSPKGNILFLREYFVPKIFLIRKKKS